jgi:peroxiredoxin
MHDLLTLPDDLPRPVDDGACRHLRGLRLPAVRLPATSGRLVDLDRLPPGVAVIFCYPRTGRPGEEALGGYERWNAIPGARGCTPQTCGYRDRHEELRALGVQLFGLSTQTTEYQREMVVRLKVPFEVLSDARLELTQALRLPTFTVEGQVLTRRLTLITIDGVVEECLYPVFPPDADAANVAVWLGARPRADES